LYSCYPYSLTYVLIKTYLQNVSLPLAQIKKIWAPVRRFTHNRFFDLYVAVFIAILVISFHGSGAEGRSGLFGISLRDYIEETSVSLASVAQSSHVIDINNLAVFEGMGGQGPQVSNSPEVSFVQQNSVLAFAPADEDYAEKGFKKNHITDYTVQSGDRLSFIALDYGVTIDSILWANKLPNADSIKPGQVLRIPPVTGIIHKVKSGDTVSSLAKQYGTSEAKIISFNNLSETAKLAINNEVIIPDGKMPSARGTTAVVSTQKDRFSLLPDLGSFFMIPATGFNWGKIHGRNGVDVANSCGTPVYASGPGKVVVASDQGWNGGFGKFIKIEHDNGTETIYAHLSKVKAVVGDVVEKGQGIANIGTTGRSTGCHLHFEVHGAQNPLVKK